MAVELAPWLAEGQPCDVCGSPTHPAPRRTRPDLEASRVALAAAVRFCEKRRPRPFKTRLREGVDYIVEREEE